ncbi:MAG: hypothetical protein WC044_10055 [Crocinitomicaceae bacterium]
MKKLLIIALLLMNSIVFAQKGHSENKGNKGNHDRPQKQEHHLNQERGHGKSNKTNIVFFVQQGKGHNRYPGKKGRENHSYPSKNHEKKRMKVYNGPGNHSNRFNGNASELKHRKEHQKSHYRNDRPNFMYLYVNTPGFYSTSNYGHWRSQQAHNKHKNYHPSFEFQAVEGFNFLIVRNRFLFEETNIKILSIRTQLEEKRSSGSITIVQYNNTLRQVVVLEQRRAALEINLVL